MAYSDSASTPSSEQAPVNDSRAEEDNLDQNSISNSIIGKTMTWFRQKIRPYSDTASTPSSEQAPVNESSAEEENLDQINISNYTAGKTIQLSSDTIRANSDSASTSSSEQATVNVPSAKEEKLEQNNINDSIVGNAIKWFRDKIGSNLDVARNDEENKEEAPRNYTHIQGDSYVSMLLLESTLVETKQNVLRLYQLPMKEIMGARNEHAKTKQFELGPRNENDLKQKTIMLVGATGTGKSTFVDGLANYILGVRLEDPFRFTVIPDEDRVRQHNQAESQTDWISCYTFKPQPGTRIKYRLNIIDTPGFGDVRGLERDNETVDQIRQLFEETGRKGVETLDAVCFILRAPDSRLTAIQKYIFHAIMGLFGHNIKGNICTVITFADGTEPAVLSAVKASDLPFGQHTFTFNNSALNSDPHKPLTSMFWENNLQNYEELFNHFETLQTKSVHLTKEVLQERRRLDITCQNLQTKIHVGLSTIDSLKKEIKIFQDNEEKIKNNENFTYTVTERKEEKVNLPDGYRDTYCLTCNETCHADCWIKYETRTGWCWAMSWLTGNCSQCRGKCHWKQHTNRTYRIETSEVQVTKTYEERKKTFQDAKDDRLTLADVLKKMAKELEKLADSIETMLNIMLECKTRLTQTALQPIPLEMTDLIDILITTETSEKKEGYLNRVKVLKKIRERATIIKSVEDFNAQRLCLKEVLAATCKDF